MAPSRICHDSLIVAIITMTFIFSSTLFLTLSVGTLNTSSGESERLVQQQRKMVLGSKPPGCVNKCLNCRPCMATLVIPSKPQWKALKSAAVYHGDKDDAYYLLLWKCKCGDKLFQP